MEGKTCPNCYQFKSPDEFGKRKSKGNIILQPYCIPCKRLLDRQYKRAKREDVLDNDLMEETVCRKY